MQKVIFFAIISLIISIIAILYTGSSSIAFFIICFFLFGTVICYFLGGKERTDTISLLTILFLTFILYMLYALIAYSGYIDGNSFFMFPNEAYFYNTSEYLGTNNSLFEIFKLCFIDRIHVDSEAFYFLIGIISYIANTFFDHNNVLLQIITVSFFAILTNLFVYKFLKNNGLSVNLLKFTLIYAIFSPIFYYSAWILRDIHIAFLFSIGLVIASSRFTLSRLLLFIPLILITIEFRIEHGIFMLVLVIYYVYFKGRYYRYSKFLFTIVIMFSIVLLAFSISFIESKLSKTIESMVNYMEFTSERVEEQGISKYLYQLPFGIKHVTLAIYSQLTQFPPWVYLEETKTSYQFLIGMVAMIKSFFWSILFIVSLISIFYNSIRKKLSTSILFLLLTFVLFLFLNVSNINERRIIALYPILFLYVCNLKLAVNGNVFNRILYKSVGMYILLISIYLCIKYI